MFVWASRKQSRLRLISNSVKRSLNHWASVYTGYFSIWSCPIFNAWLSLSQVNVFGFGASANGRWYHYFDHWHRQSINAGVHRGGAEYEIILKLVQQKRIKMYKGWWWSQVKRSTFPLLFDQNALWYVDNQWKVMARVLGCFCVQGNTQKQRKIFESVALSKRFLATCETAKLDTMCYVLVLSNESRFTVCVKPQLILNKWQFYFCFTEMPELLVMEVWTKCQITRPIKLTEPELRVVFLNYLSGPSVSDLLSQIWVRH